MRTDHKELCVRLRCVATSWHVVCDEAADLIEAQAKQIAGHLELHGRDSAELRRLCAERDEEKRCIAELRQSHADAENRASVAEESRAKLTERGLVDQKRIAYLEAQLERSERDEKQLMAALNVLREKIRYTTDEGPCCEGWQSDELMAAWGVIEAAISANKEEPK